MCYKPTLRQGAMSPLAVNLVKITVILVFFCFAECAAGSCLNYGHACWGAHGKRSGNQNTVGKEDAPNKDFKGKWFLSKLIQSPLDVHYQRERDLEIPTRFSPESLFAPNEIDNLKGQDWENIQDIFTDDQLFDDTVGRRMDSNRLKSSKILDKRSIKHN